MSYVPPHLRNSSSTLTTTCSMSLTSPAPALALRDGITGIDHTKLPCSSSSSSSSSSVCSSFDAKIIAKSSSSVSCCSSSSSSSAVLRGCYSGVVPSPRPLPVPEPVFPRWSPSDGVLLFTPQQIEELRSRLSVEISAASGSPVAPAPIESFLDMHLHPSIIKDIALFQYSTPTSIQAQAIPIALSGRDLLCCAESASGGKTAAFAIPMIQHCLAQSPVQRGDGPLALVLAPTRELAQQIEKEIKGFSRSLKSSKTAIVVGGTNISDQRSELRAGVDIIVATPGRFTDHLQQGNTSLSRVSFVVLDEADRMLDMGFEPQIREVMSNLPKKHQTLLFTATLPVEIESLAKEYLTASVQVKVGKVGSRTENVCQTLEEVSGSDKVARRKERGAAASVKEDRNALSELMGPTSINIEDKYRFMIAASNFKGEGAADSAWDD